MLGFQHKKIILVVALTVCVTPGLLFAAAKKKLPQSVKDLYFGVGLFHYYQEDYFQSITVLRAAQVKKRIIHHKDDTELIIGGMYMNYGMYLEAQKIFDTLLDKNTVPETRDRAWFLLGKGLYENGFTYEARAALAKQAPTLDEGTETHRRVLLANVMMQQKQYAAAEAVLAKAKTKNPWSIYARYNRGVAKMHLKQYDQGTKLLMELGKLKAEKIDERRSVRDKANLALGFHYGSKQPKLAKSYFEKVRLKGLLSNRALLGIGWSYLGLDNHKAALVPWLELSKRDIHDPAVLEVFLAIPAAYHKLNAFREALHQYQTSIELYKSEITQIKAAIKSVNAGRVLKLLVEDDDKQGLAAQVKLKTLPHTIENHYLIQLMSGHHFQSALKGYLNLRFLRRNIQHRRRDIGVFNNVLAFRRKAFEKRLPGIMTKYRALELPKLKRIRNDYAKQLSEIDKQGVSLSLASDKDKQLLSKLKSLKRQRAAMAVRNDLTKQEKIIRLMRKKVLWDVYTKHPKRLDKAKRNLIALDLEISKAEKLSSALLLSRDKQGGQIEQFQVRMNHHQAHLAALQKRLPVLTKRYEKYIASLAVTELDKQLKRLDIYLTQAQLGVAQIYDRARERKEGAK